MERRELFGSLTSAFRGESSTDKEETPILIRPPYNNDESLFDQQCHECDGKCATVCETDIIKIFDDKTPYLDFSKQGCTFCDECAIACEYGVLEVENMHNINAHFEISVAACVAWDGVMCMSCKDPCIDRAIIFQGLWKPVIDENKCTGCGFCASRCPVAAIDIVGLAS